MTQMVCYLHEGWSEVLVLCNIVSWYNSRWIDSNSNSGCRSCEFRCTL